MVREIFPGIYQLKIAIDSPLEFVNSYLMEGKEGWLMVDTGWNAPDVFESLSQQLKEMGLAPSDVAQIVVTHIHPDHYGLAGRLKLLYDAELAFHRAGKDFVESRYVDIDGLLAEMAQWLHVNGVPQEVEKSLETASLFMKEFVVPALPDRVLEGGETISTRRFNFEVVWTPGHSLGHICLYEREKKILISGDHILPTITPNVSLHMQSGLNPLGDYIKSLHKVESLDVELVLPAHKEPFADLRGRIGEIMSHHEERKAVIVDILGNHPRTAYEISSRVPWNTNGVSWEDLPPLDRRIAVTETLAHLEFLRVEGKVERVIDNDIAFYRNRQGNKT